MFGLFFLFMTVVCAVVAVLGTRIDTRILFGIFAIAFFTAYGMEAFTVPPTYSQVIDTTR